MRAVSIQLERTLEMTMVRFLIITELRTLIFIKKISGAVVFLEQFLGRVLLYLACRHHIFELILRLVFETKTDLPTKSPNVPLFVRFQKEWGKTRHNKLKFNNFLY